MKKAIWLAASCSASALVSAMTWVTPVYAQQAAAPAAPAAVGEVIVTARKRQESILNVPVVETALPQETLHKFQTQDLKDITTLVPGLGVGSNVLSIGTTISVRGVGTTSYDPGVDQSVSLNIDGMQFAQGLAYGSGMFDMGQVEVLKGPQSLFYGKSSPGGVISVRTADPTSKFEVIGQAGHEFVSQENRAEIIISGPLTDTLKGRLATTWGSSEGYFDNPATGNILLGSLTPARNKIAPRKDYQIRGTLLWSPTSQFDARLKINQVYDRTLYAGHQQYVSCPEGTGAVPPVNIPFLGGGEDCKNDRVMRIVDMDPAHFPGNPAAGIRGIENNGTPFLQNTQTYGTLELNYRIRPDLVLTSVTGYYNLHSNSMVNTTDTTFAAPAIGVTNHFKRHDISEEVRLNSDFAGPLNFTFGGLYQRASIGDLVTLQRNTIFDGTPIAGLLPNIAGTNDVDIKANSVFGQLRWKIIPQVEIAAGARWTDEKRSDVAHNIIDLTPLGLGILNEDVPLVNPQLKSNTTSPEVTITYKPGPDWTLFGALKRGYKSGSYDIATPAVAGVDNSFRDEKVEGYELGAKARLLDRTLAMNLAFYDYRYTGLQVGSLVPSPGLPIVVTLNAGSALVYGVDYDVSWRPAQIPGLGLNAAINWNEGHYKTLDHVPCAGGQLISQGCNEDPSPFTGAFTHQNLAGTSMIRAPKWQANFGFDYETDIGNGLTLALSNNNQYSSKYNTNLDQPYFQSGYVKADVSITLKGPQDRWEFALIGKNLNDRITAGSCSNFNAANGTVLSGQGTGTNTPGPAGRDEIACWSDPGREVWLRLTLRPFN